MYIHLTESLQEVCSKCLVTRFQEPKSSKWVGKKCLTTIGIKRDKRGQKFP